MTKRDRPIRFGAGSLCAAIVLTAVAACQSVGATGTPTTTAPAGDQQVLSVGRAYSQCVRDHGIPTFPDMVVIAGHLTLPNDATGDAADQALRADPAARDGCAAILGRLPASAQKGQVLTQQDRQNLLRYAQCIRRNGVPEWPDPNADGSFPIASTPLADQLKSARVQSAERACRQFWAGQISVK